MLKISTDQIRVFQPDAEEAFVRRVMEFLRENHADTVVRLPQAKTTVAEMAVEALREAVKGGIERGKNYGISWKSTLLSFVVLLFIGAPNFDEHTKAADFFRRTDVVEDEHLESFLDEMTDEDWAQVEENYNAEAWTLAVEV